MTCASALSASSRAKCIASPIAEGGAEAVHRRILDLHAAQHHFHRHAGETDRVAIRILNISRGSGKGFPAVDKIKKFGLGEYFTVLDNEIRGHNGSLIIFKGMQAPGFGQVRALPIAVDRRATVRCRAHGQRIRRGCVRLIYPAEARWRYVRPRNKALNLFASCRNKQSLQSVYSIAPLALCVQAYMRSMKMNAFKIALFDLAVLASRDLCG